MEELDTSSPKKVLKKIKTFSLEKLVFENRVPISLFLFGTIMLGIGVFFVKSQDNVKTNEVEILEANSGSKDNDVAIVVEVAGAIEKPGVYELENGARIEDVLIVAGGFSADADRSWIEKYVNRAAKLVDGQKLYIPRTDEHLTTETARNNRLDQTTSVVLGSQGSTIVNINTATQKELESLWGIGPVYALKIIEQRPYSSVEELIEKKIIKQNVYDRNKDSLSVY